MIIIPRKAEDFTGRKYGKLTVIERELNYRPKGVFWKCKCECGNYTIVNSASLKIGKTQSCGCKRNELRSADLSGQRFGRLLVLHRDDSDHEKFLCQCDCGKIKAIKASALVTGYTQSCGCLHRDVVKAKLTHDLIGQRFGRLLVIEKSDKGEGTRQLFWRCKCDCGNICEVRSRSLKAGSTQSCGCLKSEITSQRFSLDLVGQQFGMLTVVQRVENKQRRNTQLSQWLCKCECGSYTKAVGHDLVRGNTNSCGCLISKGEMQIRNILTELNVEYTTQYSFDDLRSDKNYPLRFDFAILKNEKLQCLIEFQGRQHFFEDYGYFGQQQRDVTDQSKREYCLKHQIPLYEIRYDDNYKDEINKILKNIT